MIDSHAHLLPEFVQNIDELVSRARDSGLQAIINSAIEPKHFISAIKLSSKYQNFVFNSFGFAPQKVKTINFQETYDYIKKHDEIKAIGEVGLDYHWVHDSKWQTKQKEIFQELIGLANEMGKPIVIHSRKAEENCITILEQCAETPVLMHCFAGTVEQTKRVIDNNWLISIPTVVVNRKKHRKIAKITPLENIVVETDTPFLSPIRGKQNEPSNVIYALKEIAILKNLSFEEVDQVTTSNAKRFYQI
ncbi:MAG: TatD family hydrolase [Candidatus Hodarchaeales archaeon]